jgi:peptidoglycan hydrolase CwlO-like protein
MKWAFAVAYAATASADEGSPIGKVIEMISDLQAKVIKEGEEVQKTYEEFSEWCEERSKEVMFEIKTGKGEVESLKASIEKEGANIATQTSAIEDLAGEIATDEADLAAATKIREKENADFTAQEKDLVETIDTLERAIGIIEKEMNGGASMMQLKRSNNVVQALSAMVSAEAISSSDGKRLTALLQSNSDDDESGAPAAAVFESSSGGVVGVLNDLLEKANSELEGARATENSALQNYEMLKGSLTDQIKFATKEKSEAGKSKAESEEAKATAEGDLKVTTADLEEDLSTLGSLHHDCMTKANEFETETKSRGEELKALATAKKIVIEATSMAQTSFLQISTGSDLVSFEAVRYVRDLSKKQHSTSLAQLASRMASTIRFGGSNKDDIFAKIKGLITDMITKLETEAEEAATEKAFCDKELSETNAKKDDKTAEIEKLTAKIDKMTSKATILKAEVATLQEELGALTKSQAEMDAIRQEEKALFEANEAELSKGLAGIQKALKVLNDYYSKDAAHGSAGGSSTGIIGLLEVCESDFSKELAEITEAEDTAAHAYEAETKENEITKVTKEQDVKFKTKEAASLDKSVSEYTSDRAGVETELGAVNEYLSELEGRCTAKAESYGDRKAAREAEIAGLKEAQTILENEASLIQTKSKHFMSVRRH